MTRTPSRGRGRPVTGPRPERGASGGSGGSKGDRRVVVLGAHRPDIAQPVAVVEVGGTLERAREGPRLALVRPVFRVEPVGLPEPVDRAVMVALAPPVLAQLEGGRRP